MESTHRGQAVLCGTAYRETSICGHPAHRRIFEAVRRVSSRGVVQYCERVPNLTWREQTLGIHGCVTGGQKRTESSAGAHRRAATASDRTVPQTQTETLGTGCTTRTTARAMPWGKIDVAFAVEESYAVCLATLCTRLCDGVVKFGWTRFPQRMDAFVLGTCPSSVFSCLHEVRSYRHASLLRWYEVIEYLDADTLKFVDALDFGGRFSCGQLVLTVSWFGTGLSLPPRAGCPSKIASRGRHVPALGRAWFFAYGG